MQEHGGDGEGEVQTMEDGHGSALPLLYIRMPMKALLLVLVYLLTKRLMVFSHPPTFLTQRL